MKTKMKRSKQKQGNPYEVSQSKHSKYKGSEACHLIKGKAKSCYKAHTRPTREALTCQAKQRREKKATSKSTSQRCTLTTQLHPNKPEKGKDATKRIKRHQKVKAYKPKKGKQTCVA